MQRPKGTRDLLGKELIATRYVERVMREIFRRYGYEEVETPAFEQLELFTKKSGSTVVKQLYTFKDRSGREFALRPELTAPVIRLFIEKFHSAPKPLKLCYFGACFRHEEPQAQRWRQFSQSGAEIIGSGRSEADAEVIALSDHMMRELGLPNYEIRVGHIRLLREALARAGVRGDLQDPILRAIDSHDEDKLSKAFASSRLKAEDEEMIRSLIALRGGMEVLTKAEGLLADLPATQSALKNLYEILEHARSFGVEKFTIDLGIARGLEYYTDCVFELYSNGVQIAGGGRYDDLVELLGGDPCPAVGVGFGIDRIARALLKRGAVASPERLDCMVLRASDEVLGESLRIAGELRRAGLAVEVDLMGRKLSKAIAHADVRGAKRAIIVGREDIEKGRVTVRDMETGEQELVPRSEIVNRLKSMP